MLASEQTRCKLDHLSVELRREFAHLPGERVEAAFRGVVDDLLGRARFEDFIPLLAHRQAREELRTERPDREPAVIGSADAVETLEAVGS